MLTSLSCSHIVRIPHHSETILKALLKLVADLCPQDDIIPEQNGTVAMGHVYFYLCILAVFGFESGGVMSYVSRGYNACVCARTHARACMCVVFSATAY